MKCRRQRHSSKRLRALSVNHRCPQTNSEGKVWLKPSTERRRTEDDTKKLTTGRSELSIHVEMCPVRAEKIPHENKLSMNTLVFRASSHKDRQLAKEETGAHRTQHTVTALAKNQSVPHQFRANDRACYLNGNKYRAANSTAPDSTTTIFCRRGVSRGACNASICTGTQRYTSHLLSASHQSTSQSEVDIVRVSHKPSTNKRSMRVLNNVVNSAFGMVQGAQSKVL